MSLISKIFRDEATGFHFQFVKSPTPSPDDAAAKFATWQAWEKDTLFEIWKSKKMNRRWQGDKTSKKEEIFQEAHSKAQSPDRPITIFEP